MKKIMLIFIMMFNIILAQVSMSDLKSLGNEQLDLLKDITVLSKKISPSELTILRFFKKKQIV